MLSTNQNYIDYLENLSEFLLNKEIIDKTASTLQQIEKSDVFIAAAKTNINDWGIDGHHTEDIDFNASECIVTISYRATRNQDKEGRFSVYDIAGQARAIINNNGEVTYQNITADIDDAVRDLTPEESVGIYWGITI